MTYQVAIAQTDSRIGDLEWNLSHHLDFINQAIEQGAQLILFPELSLTGYTLRDSVRECAVDVQRDARLAPLKEKSRSISIAFGCVENGPDHGLYNAAVFLEEGEVKHIHRKLYLPTYGMFEEGRYFSPGRSIHAFESRLGRLGMLICEDLWHLALPYLLAVDGAEVLLTLSASPTRVGNDDAKLEQAVINHEHHRVYARLLSSYVCFSNRVGFEDGVNFWGSSSMADPRGNLVVEGPPFEEKLILAEIAREQVTRARRASRHVLDENPDLVRRTLDRILRQR